MRTSKFPLSLFCAILAISACNKDDAPPSTPGPNVPATNALYDLFRSHVDDATQTFTVSATAGGMVYGSDGTVISFPPEAFRTASGGAVTGSVQVALVEALTVGKMIWLNKQTLGNDNGQQRLLRSGGEYFLNATQGGQQLKLADEAGWVSLPAINGVDPTMGLFSGNVADDGTVIWDPFANGGGLTLDSSSYDFPNDSLGWVNCDVFMGGGGAQTNVQVTCPAGYSDANTIVWLVFPDQNSMASMPNGNGNVFDLGGYYQLPVGMNMKIVAISNAGGNYTSSVTDATVSAGMNTTITFSPTTLAAFEAMVGSL